MNFKEQISKSTYPFFAFIASFSLLVIAFSLLPIMRWANIQNECIERTFRTEQTNAGIPAKVWSCNGGGD